MSEPILTQAGFVTVSGHAIDRYVERVKPAYTPKHAHWELARLLPQAEFTDQAPVWAEPTTYSRTERYDNDGFLVLCDSLAFPVSSGIVMTTMTKGSMAPVAREARSGARKRRQQRHRAMKLSERSAVRRRQYKSQGRSDSDWRSEAA